MKIFIQLGAENRVIQQGDTRGTEKDIELEVPSDHEIILNPFIFKYENGQIIKDENYQQKMISMMKRG